jgi:hypothetical protein
MLTTDQILACGDIVVARDPSLWRSNVYEILVTLRNCAYLCDDAIDEAETTVPRAAYDKQFQATGNLQA